MSANLDKVKSFILSAASSMTQEDVATVKWVTTESRWFYVKSKGDSVIDSIVKKLKIVSNSIRNSPDKSGNSKYVASISRDAAIDASKTLETFIVSCMNEARLEAKRNSEEAKEKERKEFIARRKEAIEEKKRKDAQEALSLLDTFDEGDSYEHNEESFEQEDDLDDFDDDDYQESDEGSEEEISGVDILETDI